MEGVVGGIDFVLSRALDLLHRSQRSHHDTATLYCRHECVEEENRFVLRYIFLRKGNKYIKGKTYRAEVIFPNCLLFYFISFWVGERPQAEINHSAPHGVCRERKA